MMQHHKMHSHTRAHTYVAIFQVFHAVSSGQKYSLSVQAVISLYCLNRAVLTEWGCLNKSRVVTAEAKAEGSITHMLLYFKCCMRAAHMLSELIKRSKGGSQGRKQQSTHAPREEQEAPIRKPAE
jgi:hypothetical protein